jgi:hypothetical protein
MFRLHVSCRKQVKIEIYEIIFLFAVLYGCEAWSLALRQEHRLWVLMLIWVVTLCRLHLPALKMEAVCSSETLVSTCKSTRHYNPEDERRRFSKLFFPFMNFYDFYAFTMEPV